jgi:hypothetical protein
MFCHNRPEFMRILRTDNTHEIIQERCHRNSAMLHDWLRHRPFVPTLIAGLKTIIGMLRSILGPVEAIPPRACHPGVSRHIQRSDAQFEQATMVASEDTAMSNISERRY